MSVFFSIGGTTIAAFAMFFSILAYALSFPTVYKDALSKECVAIESAKGYERCPDSPTQYGDTVLVSPNMTYEELVRRYNKKK